MFASNSGFGEFYAHVEEVQQSRRVAGFGLLSFRG
jgi:hypothetical protein